jgi:hypothetical protein
MRKILLLVTALFIICSCSMDDGGDPQFHVEILPVSSVTNLPRFVTPGRTYDLKAIYEKPTSCHTLGKFYDEKEANIITMWLQTVVVEDPECEDEVNTMVMEEATYTFKCPATYQASTCVFRFYSGNDSYGNPVYIEEEIPVRY